MRQGNTADHQVEATCIEALLYQLRTDLAKLLCGRAVIVQDNQVRQEIVLDPSDEAERIAAKISPSEKFAKAMKPENKERKRPESGA
mgnify:CR=1 FL=1|jgi:hypothetical protein